MSSLTSSPYLPIQPIAAGEKRKSGRAVCSDRGDAVWEWQVATGVFERDVTDEQLRQLEAPDLQIVEFMPTDTVWNRDTVQRSMAVRRSGRPQTRSIGPLAQLWALLRGVS